jgi:serine/threonine kinase 32
LHTLQSKKANFDATHELEELLLEDNPLKAKKRDEKRDIATLTPDMRQMEEHFLPFDHIKQVRRSYFKHSRRERVDRDGDSQSVSASSAAYTLADQPLAEMGQNGTVRGGVGANSATSSVGIPSGIPHSAVPFASTSNYRGAASAMGSAGGGGDNYEKSSAHMISTGTSRNHSTTPSASQEYARAYKAKQEPPRSAANSGSYPLQVMNEKSQ